MVAAVTEGERVGATEEVGSVAGERAKVEPRAVGWGLEAVVAAARALVEMETEVVVATVAAMVVATAVATAVATVVAMEAAETVGRSTERFSGANRRPQDHTCVGGPGGVGLTQQIA